MKFTNLDFRRQELVQFITKIANYNGFHKGEAMRFAKFIEEWEKKGAESNETFKAIKVPEGIEKERMTEEQFNQVYGEWSKVEVEFDFKPFNVGADFRITPNEIRVGMQLLKGE